MNEFEIKKWLVEWFHNNSSVDTEKINEMVSENYFTGEYNKSFPKQTVNPQRYINVCMDANNFRIMSLKEILTKIENF